MGSSLGLTMVLALGACGGDILHAEGSHSGSGVGSNPGSDLGLVGTLPVGQDPAQMPAAGTCLSADVLFVVDNSLAMGPYQAALSAAIPGFVDALHDRLPTGMDFHVGVTTTSFYAGNCGPAMAHCQEASPSYVAPYYTKPTVSSTGENGGQGRLFQFEGRPFFDAHAGDGSRAALRTWLGGALQSMGQSGCILPMSAAGAAYAVAPVNASANGAFLRDAHSILLVVVITAETDQSPEGLSAYHDMVVAAKHACGGDSCVLMAGLFDPCVSDTTPANPLWQFMSAFHRTPRWGTISATAAQYVQVVSDAVGQVTTQRCDQPDVQ